MLQLYSITQEFDDEAFRASLALIVPPVVKPEPVDGDATQEPATAVARPIATPLRAAVKGELHEAVAVGDTQASNQAETAIAKHKQPRMPTRQDIH